MAKKLPSNLQPCPSLLRAGVTGTCCSIKYVLGAFIVSLNPRGQDFTLALSSPPPLLRRVLKVRLGEGKGVIGSWSVRELG